MSIIIACPGQAACRFGTMLTRLGEEQVFGKLPARENLAAIQRAGAELILTYWANILFAD
ncbi:MAG: hypothetical protein ISR84_01385 [Kiritimatiellales bacterium]|nr:hypothetical protein [Kiritimatiellales bacterium]